MVALIRERPAHAQTDRADLDEVEMLAALWAKNGWHLERLTSGWTCVVEPCSTIAFVALKTADGKKSVCLKHFEAIGKQAGIRAPKVKTPAA